MTVLTQECLQTERGAGGLQLFEPASHYVTEAYYDWLVAVSAELASPDVRPVLHDAGLARMIQHLLATEARLLDQKAFGPWLGLFHDECAYWIPSDVPAPDPRKVVTLEFHDRRRLLDRASRLETGFAYSQYPASRTAHAFTGLEIWPSPDRPDEWRARCNMTVCEYRNGHHRVLAGWNGFVVRQTDAGLRIVVKQINLIDCDRPQGNNSFFL